MDGVGGMEGYSVAPAFVEDVPEPGLWPQEEGVIIKGDMAQPVIQKTVELLAYGLEWSLAEAWAEHGAGAVRAGEGAASGAQEDTESWFVEDVLGQGKAWA